MGWLSEGNDCNKCKALWEDCSWDGEHDCGCMIKGNCFDEKPCRLPRPIRWLLTRKAEYHNNHVWDGCEDYYMKLEQKEEKCQEKLEKILEDYEICETNKNGELIKYNKEYWITDHTYEIVDACKEEYKPPEKLYTRWLKLLKETLMIIPNKIKPYICK